MVDGVLRTVVPAPGTKITLLGAGFYRDGAPADCAHLPTRTIVPTGRAKLGLQSIVLYHATSNLFGVLEKGGDGAVSVVVGDTYYYLDPPCVPDEMRLKGWVMLTRAGTDVPADLVFRVRAPIKSIHHVRRTVTTNQTTADPERLRFFAAPFVVAPVVAHENGLDVRAGTLVLLEHLRRLADPTAWLAAQGADVALTGLGGPVATSRPVPPDVEHVADAALAVVRARLAGVADPPMFRALDALGVMDYDTYFECQLVLYLILAQIGLADTQYDIVNWV
jgi:hypothetical protein